jgi:hypothetical protein
VVSTDVPGAGKEDGGTGPRTESARNGTMDWYSAATEATHRRTELARDGALVRAGRAARLRKARRQLARVLHIDRPADGRGAVGRQGEPDDAEASARAVRLVA